jgi:SAM-dependent methyltransferase
MTAIHDKPLSTPDEVNRAAWSTAEVVHEFGDDGSPLSIETWSDAGERAAITSVASEARGRPILDVGVGGGRTTTMLRLVSDDYIGVDYTSEMVAACRRNYPGADIRWGDVRNLSDFDDGHFQLVVFSYNGLDAIDHGDRAQALAEMSRVLAPGGLLVLSTHNKVGPCFRASPWRKAHSPSLATWSFADRLGRFLVHVAGIPLHFPRALANRHRLMKSAEEGPGWAVRPVEAHDFGLLIHYVTLEEAAAEFGRAGLTLERAFDAERGATVTVGDDVSGVRYFHLVARKR